MHFISVGAVMCRIDTTYPCNYRKRLWQSSQSLPYVFERRQRPLSCKITRPQSLWGEVVKTRGNSSTPAI